MKIQNLNHKIHIAILIIISVSILFRFYNFSNWLMFGMDQEYEAFLVKNILTSKHFPLIGVNASDTGLYLGPLFIYFASLLGLITNRALLAWGFIASLTGVGVTYLVYKVSSKMFSIRVGLIASFLYASSFLVSFYERQFWNPMFIPLFSLLIGYTLFQIHRGHPKKFITLLFLFGIAIQCHLSILIFTPVIGYVVFKNKEKISKKIFIWGLLVFIFLQLPIVVFDFRHNFINTKAAFALIKQEQVSAHPSLFSDRVYLFMSMIGRFFSMSVSPDLFVESGQCKELTYLRKNALLEGVLLFFLISTLLIIRKKTLENPQMNFLHFRNWDKSRPILLLLFGSTVLYIIFYKREIFEYYFLYFLPWLAIFFGLVLDFVSRESKGHRIVLPIMGIFLLINISTLLTAKLSYSFNDKLNMLTYVKQHLEGKTYALEALGECARFGGYRYLFEKYVGIPFYSYMDSYFSWLYPDSIVVNTPDRVVLLSLIDERERASLQKWQEAKLAILDKYKIEGRKKFGKIDLYILSSK